MTLGSAFASAEGDCRDPVGSALVGGVSREDGSVAQFQIPIPLWLRLPVAAVLGPRTDRRWTVPVAATLTLPVLWVSGFAICAALASEALRNPTGRSSKRTPPVGPELT